MQNNENKLQSLEEKRDKLFNQIRKINEKIHNIKLEECEKGNHEVNYYYRPSNPIQGEYDLEVYSCKICGKNGECVNIDYRTKEYKNEEDYFSLKKIYDKNKYK